MGHSGEDFAIQWNARSLQIATVVLPSVAGLSLLLRLLTRSCLLRNIAAEDIFLVIAFALAVVVSAETEQEMSLGVGRQGADVPYSDIKKIFKSVYISVVMYTLGVIFTKISILFQYRRVSGADEVARRVVNCTLGGMIVLGFVQSGTTMYPCRPLAYFWDRTIPGGRCLDISVLWRANSVATITTDFIILFLPFLILRNSTIPTIDKFIVAFLLSLGGLASVSAIFRFIALHKGLKTKNLQVVLNLALWSTVEVNVGITCTCLSSLRPLVTRLALSTCAKRIEGRSHRGRGMDIPTISTEESGFSFKKPAEQATSAPGDN